MRALFQLGLPAAGQTGVEYLVYTVATVLVGRLNATSLAAHQLALSTVYTTYMLPLGISSAAAVRVGQALGAWRFARRGAIGLDRGGVRSRRHVRRGAGAADCAAFDRTPVHAAGGGDRREPRPCCASPRSFNCSTDCRWSPPERLRGAGDTRTPMLCHFAGYWLIGLPLGVWLCFTRGWGAPGLWTGLSAGLILIGFALTLRWRRAASGFAMLKW